MRLIASNDDDAFVADLDRFRSRARTRDRITNCTMATIGLALLALLAAIPFLIYWILSLCAEPIFPMVRSWFGPNAQALLELILATFS